jgi:hypothetical protein
MKGDHGMRGVITEWTEGVCDDGAAILRDGEMVPITELLATLNEYEVSVHDLKGALRGVIFEMEQIVGECQLARDWKRVEMLAHNVHTVLRNKLVR